MSHYSHFICFFFIFAVFVSFSNGSPHADLALLQTSDIFREFEAFQKEFNKNYSTIEETLKRYEIFKTNLHLSFQHKIMNPTAHYGVTFFSDMTSEEFHESFLKMKGASEKMPSFNVNFIKEMKIDLGDDFEIPNSFDWREKGVDAPVESQGACWSCWAFTAVTNIEALYYIKYGKKVKLSEQQLVDCDPNNDGCKGGLMTKAYDYIMDVGGLMLEKDYPYADRRQNCSFDKAKAAVNIQGYTRIGESAHDITKALLKIGPLGAGINGRFLQFYKGGIIDLPTCTSDLTHAVLIVGYGVEETKNGDKQEYWILKNEWGGAWGEKGYFRIKKIEGDGICGINTYVSTAIISDNFAVQE